MIAIARISSAFNGEVATPQRPGTQFQTNFRDYDLSVHTQTDRERETYRQTDMGIGRTISGYDMV